MAKIAIVGAGMAGLTALQALSEAGHEVTVFDKSRGSGGRLASKKLSGISWDMGAQFMRAHTTEFAQALSQWQDKGWVDVWDIQPHQIDTQGIHESPDDITRYVGVNRMTALSRHLLKAATYFVPNTRIERCDYKNGQWWLYSEAGECFPNYDALIINAPPEQARALTCEDMSAGIKAQMDANWTLLLAFEFPIDTPVNAAYVKEGPIAWVARNNSKPQREPNEAWVIQANAQWSNEHVNTPRMTVQESLQTAFFETLNVDPQKVTECWLHRWLYAIPKKSIEQNPLTDESRNLCVCGDWFNRAAVEGAFMSGLATGESMLAMLDG